MDTRVNEPWYVRKARLAQQRNPQKHPVQLEIGEPMEVIAYTYDADIHCESCMLDYARAVPYKDYEFGNHTDADISDSPGIINVAKAVELGIIRDSEGNPIHAMFDNDEWYANDIYEGKRTATLNCSDCGKELDRWDEVNDRF